MGDLIGYTDTGSMVHQRTITRRIFIGSRSCININNSVPDYGFQVEEAIYISRDDGSADNDVYLY